MAKLTTLPRDSDVLSIWRGRQAPRFESRRITVRLCIMAKRSCSWSWAETMRNTALLGLVQPNSGQRKFRFSAGRRTLVMFLLNSGRRNKHIFRAYPSTPKTAELCFEILQSIRSARLFRLTPSSRSRHRLCWRTATTIHFWSSTLYTTFHREATLKTALELLDTVSRFEAKCRQYNNTRNSPTKSITSVSNSQRGGVVSRFLTARTHCMENGQSVFFLSPHTPSSRA